MKRDENQVTQIKLADGTRIELSPAGLRKVTVSVTTHRGLRVEYTLRGEESMEVGRAHVDAMQAATPDETPGYDMAPEIHELLERDE